MTLFLREMRDNGVISLGLHLLSFAHSDQNVDKMISAYRSVLSNLKEGLEEGSLIMMLRCEPLKPLFKVRKGT